MPRKVSRFESARGLFPDGKSPSDRGRRQGPGPSSEAIQRRPNRGSPRQRGQSRNAAMRLTFDNAADDSARPKKGRRLTASDDATLHLNFPKAYAGGAARQPAKTFMSSYYFFEDAVEEKVGRSSRLYSAVFAKSRPPPKPLLARSAAITRARQGPSGASRPAATAREERGNRSDRASGASVPEGLLHQKGKAPHGSI